MALTKPTKTPRWADTGTRTEPAEGKKDTGWIFEEEPPFGYFNWLQGIAGDWCKWLNERLFDGSSSSDFKVKAPESPGVLTLEGYDGTGASGGPATVLGGTTDTADTDGGTGAVSGGTSKGSGSSVAEIKAATAGGSGSTDRVPEVYAKADGATERFSLLKALRALVASADPAGGAAGDLYVNDNGSGAGAKLRAHNGGGWDRYVPQAFAAIADSSEITNSTTEDTFDQTYTIPANTLKAGSTIRVRGTGDVLQVAGTPTLTIKLRVGSGTFYVFTIAHTNVVSPDNFSFDAIVTVRGTGGSAAVRSQSLVHFGGLADQVEAGIAAFQSINTGVANEVRVTGQWSAASASNRVVLTNFVVDVL